MSALASKSYDLVIVGAGIVGATLAVLLSQRAPGLHIALVDGGSPKVFDLTRLDSRVIALSKASESLYRSLGVWEALIATRACAYSDMRVWDGDGTSDIHFDCADIDSDNLGHIVENSVLNTILLDSLARARNIELQFGLRVASLSLATSSDDVCRISFANGESLSSSLVVAADGANSPLRELLGFPVRRWDYGQHAIVTSVKTEKPHQNTAWQRFAKEGPLAFLPLAKSPGDQHHCSVVWSQDTQESQRLMALDEQDFSAHLARTFEYRLGAVAQVGERLSFPLVQRHATHYSKPGLILVGDAAHTIHPLAGQGTNLGIYDVEVLAKEIARAVARDMPIGDVSVARRYERQRQLHNVLAMSAMEVFKRLFGSDDLALRWLRNSGVRAVDANHWLKNKLSRLASGHL